MKILKAMKRSPLGLDLYLWLTYRTFGLTRPLRLTWPLLYRQFGVDPARAGEANTVQNFRKDCGGSWTRGGGLATAAQPALYVPYRGA